MARFRDYFDQVLFGVPRYIKSLASSTPSGVEEEQVKLIILVTLMMMNLQVDLKRRQILRAYSCPVRGRASASAIPPRALAISNFQRDGSLRPDLGKRSNTEFISTTDDAEDSMLSAESSFTHLIQSHTREELI